MSYQSFKHINEVGPTFRENAFVSYFVKSIPTIYVLQVKPLLRHIQLALLASRKPCGIEPLRLTLTTIIVNALYSLLAGRRLKTRITWRPNGVAHRVGHAFALPVAAHVARLEEGAGLVGQEAVLDNELFAKTVKMDTICQRTLKEAMRRLCLCSTYVAR